MSDFEAKARELRVRWFGFGPPGGADAIATALREAHAQGRREGYCEGQASMVAEAGDEVP